jgi:hypothetical protein
MKAARLFLFFDGCAALEINSEYIVLRRDRHEAVSVFVGSFHENNGHIDINLLQILNSSQHMDGNYLYSKVLSAFESSTLQIDGELDPKNKTLLLSPLHKAEKETVNKVQKWDFDGEIHDIDEELLQQRGKPRPPFQHILWFLREYHPLKH